MNYKEIMELTQWLERSSFTTYSLTVNGMSLSTSKQQTAAQPFVQPAVMPPMPPISAMPVQAPVAAMPQPSAEPLMTAVPVAATPAADTAAQGHIIRSPIVGTYYESSNPESPALVKVGQKVKKGDVLCILEAMKVMNEITSDVDGVVMEIFASNGDMAEARMPLFRIEV